MEKEYRKLQDKHREAINNEYNLSTVKDHLEASLKISQEDVQRINSQYEEDYMKWKQERIDLQGKI